MPRILVADDDPPVRNALCRIIRRKGWSPYSASDGQEALDLAARHELDLVILDVKMPRRDGMEVLKVLAGQKVRPAVLMITAHGDAALAKTLIELGADGCIEKPFDLENLEERIESLLGRGGR